MSANAEKMDRLMDELSLVVDGEAGAVARHADFLAENDAAADLRHEAGRAAERVRQAGVDYAPPSDLDVKVLAALDARGTGRTTQPGGLLGASALTDASALADAPIDGAQAVVRSGEQPASGTAPTVAMEAMVAAEALSLEGVPETPSKEAGRGLRADRARSAHEEPMPEGNVVSIDRARARRRALAAGLGVLGAITATAIAGAAALFLWNRPSGDDGVTSVADAGGLTGRITRIVRAAGGDAGSGLEVRVAGGNYAAASVDAALAAGSSLRTDGRTRVEISLSDGSQVVLNHSTELSLDAASARGMRLSEGEILADIEHLDAGPNFAIATPTGAIEVLGTRFDLTATQELTSVRVTRGKVALSSTDGRRADVEIGEEGVVRAGGAPTVVPSIDLARAVGWASELQNEDGAESTSEETIAGIGSLRARRPGEREDRERPLTIASHDIRVRIVGNVARTEIEEVFRNDSDQELEGIYRFPMPPGAHIARLALDVNGAMEEAAFVPRERASRIWTGVIRNATRPAARNANEEFIWVSGPWRDPALLEWQRGGSFELRIFPIPAHGERRVSIAYTETIAPSAEGRRYVYPMAHSRDDSTRIGQMSLDVRVAGAASVTARGYATTSAAEGDATRVSYTASDFRPNGDLVIDYALPAGERELSYWTYADAPGASSVTAPPDRSRERDDDVLAAHRALVADGRGYVAFALRPTLPARTEGRSRDYVIVVDSSQSMVGERWDRARHLVAGVVAELDRRDRFTVMACDLECRSIDAGGATTRSFRTPTSAEVRAVDAWLATIEPAGASDLGATLRRAAELPASAGAARDTHVIYVGDGVASVGHRAAGTLGEIAAEVARTRNVSITTVGIGQDADTVALGAIARSGGGHYVPYVPGQRTSAAALAVLETTYGVSLEAPEVTLPSGLSDRAPAALPTIRNGEEVVIVARMDQPTVNGEVVLRGTVGGAPFEQRYTVALTATNAAGNLFVPQLWASGTIERLELEGRGEDEARIIALSRGYRVMSRHTSLLVLESEAMFRAFGIDRGEAGATWTGEEDVVGGGSDGAVAVADEMSVATGTVGALAGGSAGRGAGSGYGVGAGAGMRRSEASAAAPMMDDADMSERETRGDASRARIPARTSSSASDAAAEPPATATPMARAPGGGGRVGSGSWMRRVYYRVGEVGREGAPTFNETEAARRAEEALRASPDSRDRHRAAVRALARAGNLERALEVAEAWFSRDRIDPEALAARADLTARLGREDDALRLLSGTVDLRADDATLHDRLAAAYDRAGETERACAHRISLAEIDPSAERVGAALRCERAAGRASLADAVLRSVRDERVRRNAEAAAATTPELRTRGDLTVDATWSGGDDIDVALITPDGTRISWMGGRTTVVGRDARAPGRELIGLSRATVGNYVVEISRTGRDGTSLSGAGRAISGDLRIRVLDETETVHFTLPEGEDHRAVARAIVRRESRLEPVSGGGW